MIPGKRNITIYRGDTRTLDLTLSRRFIENDQEIVEPIDLTDHIFHSQIRVDPNSTQIEAEFTCTILDAVNGKVELELPPGESEKLNIAQMYWDVQSEFEGDVQTWLFGTVTVMFDITRIEAGE